MNAVEKFKQGRKVRIILPNGTVAEERGVGNFVKLKGEDFYRRVNSDGTLTKVGLNPNEYPVSKSAPKVKSETMYQINKDRKSKGLQEIDYNGDLRTTHYPSALDNFWYGTLSRTEGSNDFWSSVGSVLGAGFTGTNGNWYDGKYHAPREFKNALTNVRHGGNEITNGKRDDYQNYVRAFTLKDYTGFKPSDKIKRGRYTNIKQYSDLPYVLGKFYGDTAYIQPKYQPIIDVNIGQTYRVNKDDLVVGSRNYVDTYDARNHYVSFTGTKDRPALLFEDVFNTNNDFVDQHNYPIIVNQEIPIVYTDDENKLNQWPTLTKWLQMPFTFETKTKD